MNGGKPTQIIVVGPDHHGDWPKDIYLGIKQAGIGAELIFTNTLVKGTDNNTDISKRARLEKIKQLFRNYARPVFNYVKKRRRLMAERSLFDQVNAAHRPGEKLHVMFMWTPPSIETLKILKENKDIVLSLWLGEAPIREPLWPATFPHFDHFIYVDEEWYPILAPDVQKKSAYIPLASTPEKFFPIKPEEKNDKFKCDIAFVGYYLDERAEVLSVVKDYDLHIYGYRWENGFEKFPWLKEKWKGPLSNEDANQAFNGAKIEIGRALSFVKFGHVVTQRVFDISLAGNFQLSGYAPSLEKMFGDSIPMFNDAKELKEKVDYYLAHPEERERLAKKAHEICLREHTYAHRVQELIKVLGITA
ncbi:MAG TPA: glycosyltransferase [Candidatus Paceibacterota bacterium]|nr:glycosyltransferase [Candidatus Paceibacterota bacterium]